MKKVLFIMIIQLLIYNSLFSQGNWTQTSTSEFNQNINFNINTTNDEMKLINDVGTGVDGDLYVPPGITLKTDLIKTPVTLNNPSGQNAIQVSATSGFNIGDEILIITMQDNNSDLGNNLTGQFEFKRIQNKTATALILTENLVNTYNLTGKKHQVQKVFNYNNVTIDYGGILTCDDWNGIIGGIIIFRVKGILILNSLGKINASYKGYIGGQNVVGGWQNGYQGEGLLGSGIQGNYSANGNSGGCGMMEVTYSSAGGGGGSYGTYGTQGITTFDTWWYPIHGGDSGRVIGNQFLSKLYMGGSGGSGGTYEGTSGKGGDGGGIIYISCDSIEIIGTIECNGENGNNGLNNGGGGGAGAGGSIYIISKKQINLGNNFVTSNNGLKGLAGSGPGNGGNGGLGRIRIDAPQIIGTSNPPVGYNGTNYALLGTSITPLIVKPSNNFWGTLSFNVNTSAPGTSIQVDVLNDNNVIIVSGVATGTFLNNIGVTQNYNSIKLKARLINSFGNQTPILYDWSVQWTTSDIRTISENIPQEFYLSQNYPNPFNPTTKINFDVPQNEFITLKIYDNLGKEIVTLVNEKLSPGSYSVDWNASEYPSGVYFYRLSTGNFTQTKRMILLK